MSINDVIHLETHFSNWSCHRAVGLKGFEPFNYYAIEQILKPYNLEDSDIKYGISDGPNDGGIDGIYVIANRNTMVRDDLDIAISGTSQIRLILLQIKGSKTETGFNAVDVEKFRMFTEDIMDLSASASNFSHKYNQKLLTIMHTFKEQYKKIAGLFPSFAVDYYYVTRGDETIIEPATADSVKTLTATVTKWMGGATTSFNPVNTQALLEFVKMRRQKGRTLTWYGQPALAFDNGFIGLVSLADYVTFLKGADGELNEELFESNVRGYQRDTPVNKQIRASLSGHSSGLDFWRLNNGITIITTGQTSPLPPRDLNIEDPQVVNGLQTSREIFKYFKDKRGEGDQSKAPKDIAPLGGWSVLIKVIRVADEATRDAIIKATNSQNTMDSASLRSTDVIHSQIEELFQQFGLFYDRRKGYYKDQQKAIDSIVSVVELVQAMVSVIRHKPDDARARPRDYITKDTKYKSIFGKDVVPLSAYYAAMRLIRMVDEFLDTKDIGAGDQRNIKFYLAYAIACESTKRLNPSGEDIIRIDFDQLTNEVMEAQFSIVWESYTSLQTMTETSDIIARGPKLLKALRSKLEAQYKDEPPSTRSGKKRLAIRDAIASARLPGMQVK